MRLTRAEVDEYRSLRTREGRGAAGRFLLEGWRALAAAVAAKAPIVSVAVRAEDAERPELAALAGVPVRTIGERDLQRISATEHSQGVIAQVEIVRHEVQKLWSPGHRLVLALDGVSDPGNLGTILRTADWFGAAGVVLSPGCVDPFNEKVVRSTVGSLFYLPVVADAPWPETLKKAKAAGFSIVSADSHGAVSLSEWRPKNRTLIVLGSEAHGISPAVAELADMAVSIPRHGQAESLNVAVAAGVLLQHATKS